jgi:hypothetical protein
LQTPVVFIERAFLDKLSEELTGTIDSIDLLFFDFYTFLKDGIMEFTLVMDAETEEELVSYFRTNLIFDRIWNKIKGYYCLIDFEIVFEEEPGASIEEFVSPFSLFLVDWDLTTCNQFESKTGFLFFNLEKLKKRWSDYSYYGKEREKYISSTYLDKSTTFEGWEKVTFNKQPFHSIFLLDLYLYKAPETIEENFPLLLLSILKDDIYEDVHFLTFSGKTNIATSEEICGYCRDGFVKALMSMGETKSEARKIFKRLNLNILKTYSNKTSKRSIRTIHDRFLLTNNVLISSPGGFDIYGNSREKNTFIRFDFIFYKDVFLRASGYVDNIGEYIKGLINQNNCYPPDQIDRIKNHPFFKDANRSD